MQLSAPVSCHGKGDKPVGTTIGKGVPGEMPQIANGVTTVVLSNMTAYLPLGRMQPWVWRTKKFKQDRTRVVRLKGSALDWHGRFKLDIYCTSVRSD